MLPAVQGHLCQSWEFTTVLRKKHLLTCSSIFPKITCRFTQNCINILEKWQILTMWKLDILSRISRPAHAYVDNRLLLERWTTAQTAVLCRYLNGRFYDRSERTILRTLAHHIDWLSVVYRNYLYYCVLLLRTLRTLLYKLNCTCIY